MQIYWDQEGPQGPPRNPLGLLPLQTRLPNQRRSACKLCQPPEEPWPGHAMTTLTYLWQCISDERGQDLIEYTLLLAFVCLSSAALFLGAGLELASIWETTKLILNNAAKSVS